MKLPGEIIKDEILDLKPLLIFSDDIINYQNFKAYKFGKFVLINGILCISNVSERYKPLIMGFPKPYGNNAFMPLVPIDETSKIVSSEGAYIDASGNFKSDNSVLEHWYTISAIYLTN